jgi:mannitol 2-dehydrogenase
MNKLIPLNKENLAKFEGSLPIPSYDLSKRHAGIVHIGVGAFHRAHQAYYCHQLLSQPDSMEWALTGVGLMEYDRKTYQALTSQDGLYTLTIQSPDGSSHTELIGSICEMLLAVETPEVVLDKMADPNTKVISMTITEGGYNFDPNTGIFNHDDPSVSDDIKNPATPKTFFGYIAEALRRRRDRGAGPVTILSCDNVQHNGDVAKMVIKAFCHKQDPSILEWIEDHVSFPNSMVDRITPKISSDTIQYVQDQYGIEDAVPVNCEPFIQWIIEDNFINGRPQLESVEVQFVDDVTPYEEMKLRLLNAGHSVVGITGAIHGYPTIDRCIADDVISNYLRAYLDREASPVLTPVDGIDVEEYIETLIERFGNANIKDSAARICSESSAKLPKFLLPTIQKNLKGGGAIELGTLIIAAWCYYHDKGVDEQGNPLEIIDEMAEQLAIQAKKTTDDPLSFLRQPEIFGDLVDDQRFSDVYVKLIKKIYERGDIIKVMASCLKQ